MWTGLRGFAALKIPSLTLANVALADTVHALVDRITIVSIDAAGLVLSVASGQLLALIEGNTVA